MVDFRVSAPGSVMVTGEHAVLRGHPAIVCAIAQRIRIAVTCLKDRKVRITSEIAPPLEADLEDLPSGGPYRFILACLASSELSEGVWLEITSEIDPTLGLGSSAALVAAGMVMMQALTGRREDVHSPGLAIIRAVQDRGSGADLAASLRGGVQAYALPKAMVAATPTGAGAEITPLPPLPPLSLRYVGYKTPTADVLHYVASAWRDRAEELDALYAEMGKLAEQAIAAHRAGQGADFAESLNTYQLFMERLGVSDDGLRDLLEAARAHPGCLAAKISGSGLGDCVLALGDTPPGFSALRLDEEGVRFEP